VRVYTNVQGCDSACHTMLRLQTCSAVLRASTFTVLLLSCDLFSVDALTSKYLTGAARELVRRYGENILYLEAMQRHCGSMTTWSVQGVHYIDLTDH
jgi:hypothetical protein